MAKTLAEVLAAPTDNDVCSGLYSLLIARYGKHFDPTSLPVEHRTAFLVWHVNNIIGNGGFNGFFKADFAIDPKYLHLREAYEAVGCEPATAAVRRVFDSFTNRTPPSDPADRMRAFVRANNAVQGALNRDYFKASNELVTALAKYIREHSAAFAEIEKPPEPYAVAGAQAPAVAQIPIADPVETGLKWLPRWARAAFFANCGRLTLPLWENAWSDAPADYQQAVEQAVILAELCATEGNAVGDLRSATALTVGAAEAAAAPDPKGRMGAPAPSNPVAAVNVALTAASTLDFISGDNEAEPYGFAKAAMESAGRMDLLELVQDHFQRVKRLGREGDWTDKTPVPPEIFRADFESRGKSWWKRW
jgi:hypothetical protein